MKAPNAAFSDAIHAGKSVFLAWGSDADPRTGPWAQDLRAALATTSATGLRFQFQAYPQEKHGTIHHPAALPAFRTLLKPVH